MDMAILPRSGELDVHPLPRLLLELRRTRFCGALCLSRERTEKRILFQDGSPIFAESNLASESLGVQLVDEGRITRQDLAAVTQRIDERQVKEGVALLELKLLSPKELFLALKDQIRRRLIECFGWPTGSYRLEPGETLPGDAQAFRIDLFELVHAGIARHWTSDRMLAELAERLDRIAAATPRAESIHRRLEGKSDLQPMFDALDGSQTLAEAIHRAGSAGAISAAWLLDASGALEYPRRAEQDEKPDDPPALEIVFDETVDDARRVGPSAPKERVTTEPTREASALREVLLARHAALGEMTHYSVLELEPDCDAEAIKRAYFAAAKRFHPDALARSGFEDLRREANDLFARIAKAYAVLSDPHRRRDYDAELGGAASSDADRLANAESLYRLGEILLRKGDFAGAFEYLKPVVDLWPEECAYQSALGWCYYKMNPPDTEAARRHLEKSVQMGADDAVANFRLGILLRSLGEAERAETFLARAKQINPKVTGR